MMTFTDNTFVKDPPCLRQFFHFALLPLGNTMYIWGGGWNDSDTGAGTSARMLGVSPLWKAFADRQTSCFCHQRFRYRRRNGLDCSGYVGWVLYNMLERSDLQRGYVFHSSKAAAVYASLGLGCFTPAGSVSDWRPGDIASMPGHVWISLGSCDDGSVLLIHSSPPGVRLCGTLRNGNASEASALAEDHMRFYYPTWYRRFPECTVKDAYLTDSGRMRWNARLFPDAAFYQGMPATELVKALFSGRTCSTHISL